MRGYQAAQKRNLAKGGTECQNGKQALETIFYWNSFFELRKREVVGNHFIEYFSVQRYVRYQMIHLRIVCFPFHTRRSPAKIQPAIALDSPGEFHRQPALNDNPVCIVMYGYVVTIVR